MFISTKEAMSLLCIESRTQMDRLKNRGVITAYKPFGRVLYKRDEIIRLIEESRLQPRIIAVNNKNRMKSKTTGYEPYDGSRDWLRRQAGVQREIRA